MRRVWAAVLAVWATIAIVGVLAWSHPQPSVSAQGTSMTVVVQGKNGKRQLARVVALPTGSPAVASTHSSTVPATTTTGGAGSGAGVFVPASSVQPVATTHSS
jgi:hypothetical protein